MKDRTFSSTVSDVSQEGTNIPYYIKLLKKIDLEILKIINGEQIMAIILILIDLIFCIGMTIFEAYFFVGEYITFILINTIPITSVILIIIIFILVKKKIFCLIGGYIYLILGSLFWFFKLLYTFYLIFGRKIDEYFKTEYGSNGFNFIPFIVHLLLIIIRLWCFNSIKRICKLQDSMNLYYLQKEQADILIKINEEFGSNINEDEYKIKFDSESNESEKDNEKII